MTEPMRVRRSRARTGISGRGAKPVSLPPGASALDKDANHRTRRRSTTSSIVVHELLREVPRSIASCSVLAGILGIALRSCQLPGTCSNRSESVRTLAIRSHRHSGEGPAPYQSTGQESRGAETFTSSTLNTYAPCTPMANFAAE